MIDIKAFSTALEKSSDGVWRAPSTEEIHYGEMGHSACFAVEDTSFWFGHRNRCITSLITSNPPPDGKTVFDVGGGNGFVSYGLSQQGYDPVLIEPGTTGIENAKSRGLKNIIHGTTQSSGLINNSIPAIGLFDVIEHIEDDRAFCREMNRLLMDRGMLYATVPAYQGLWSDDDVKAGHFKRYTRKSLSALLNACGFEVVYSTYIFWFLPLPVYVFRTLPAKLINNKNNANHDTVRKVEKDHSARKSFVGDLVSRALYPETKAIDQGISLPFGGSCLLAARKISTASDS
ncbi:MAG: class I SAM-dependent methyltransferase [Pseudomonadota bacterium]